MVSILVLQRKIPGLRLDRNQLFSRCILHLISLSHKQAQAKPEGLRPLNIVVPADPHNKTQEWRTNMKAKVPNPKQFPSFKMDTKSETGVKECGKIIFRVPSFRVIFVDVSFNAMSACRQNP